MHRASWQTITWVLVAAILVYVLLGPNLISWGLAIVGVVGAVIKAAEEHWVTWQLARRRQVSREPQRTMAQSPLVGPCCLSQPRFSAAKGQG